MALKAKTIHANNVNILIILHFGYSLTDRGLEMDSIYYVLILFIISNALDYRWDAVNPKQIQRSSAKPNQTNQPKFGLNN